MTLKSITTRPESFSNSTLKFYTTVQRVLYYFLKSGVAAGDTKPFLGALRGSTKKITRAWTTAITKKLRQETVKCVHSLAGTASSFLLHKQTLPGSDAIDVIDGAWREQMAGGCFLEPARVWGSFLPWRTFAFKKENGMLSILWLLTVKWVIPTLPSWVLPTPSPQDLASIFWQGLAWDLGAQKQLRPLVCEWLFNVQAAFSRPNPTLCFSWSRTEQPLSLEEDLAPSKAWMEEKGWNDRLLGAMSSGAVASVWSRGNNSLHKPFTRELGD